MVRAVVLLLLTSMTSLAVFAQVDYAISTMSGTPAASICGSGFAETTMDIAVILDRDHCDFKQPRLLRMAAALNLTTLRVGGTQGDFLFYNLTSNEDPPMWPPPAPYTRVLSARMLQRAVSFISSIPRLHFVFGMNAGPGPRDPVTKRWRPDAARALLQWFRSQQAPLVGLEFGNELNLFLYNMPPGDVYNGTQIAADLATFFQLVREEGTARTTWEIFCCDVAYMPIIGESWPFMKEFAGVNGSLTPVQATGGAVTWHFYPLLGGHYPSKDDPLKATPEKLFSPLVLNQVGSWADHLAADFNGAAVVPAFILGETGSAVGGGQAGVSDRFCDVVEYIDKLGQMAVRGQRRVWRQTLCGSPDQYYGLISHDLTARPSYFALLLFRTLLAPCASQTCQSNVNVYSMSVNATMPPSTIWGPSLRSYGFGSGNESACTSPPRGEIGHRRPLGCLDYWRVVLMINLAEEATPINGTSLDIEGHVPYANGTIVRVAWFALTAPTINATTVELNGIVLNVTDAGNAPAMVPVSVWAAVEHVHTTSRLRFLGQSILPRSVNFIGLPYHG